MVALVEGSERYAVRLEAAEGDLLFSCGCPFFERDLEACKHVWAVLLALDARGLLVDLLPSGTFDLIPEPEVDADPEVLEDEDWDDLETEAIPASPVPRGPEPRPVPAREGSPPSGGPALSLPVSGGGSRPPPPHPPWRNVLAAVTSRPESSTLERRALWQRRRLFYRIDRAATLENGHLTLETVFRELRRDGSWGALRSAAVSNQDLANVADPFDRRVLALLAGAEADPYGWSSYTPYRPGRSRYRLSEELAEVVLPMVAGRGRLLLSGEAESAEPAALALDEGPAWAPALCVERQADPPGFRVTALLERGEERMDLAAPELVLGGGWVIAAGRLARLKDEETFPWVALLRRLREFFVPEREAGEWLAEMLRSPRSPALRLPQELELEEVRGEARPRLSVRSPEASGPAGRLLADLSFDYDGQLVAAGSSEPALLRLDRRQRIQRNLDAERGAASLLASLGAEPAPVSRSARAVYPAVGAGPDPLAAAPAARPDGVPGLFALAARDLPGLVRRLFAAGWHVEAAGRRYRSAGTILVEVSSGIDWFDLAGGVVFGEQVVTFPELLAALARGQGFVSLGDGTLGLLPEQWLRRHGLLAGMGRKQGERLRFSRAQLGVLDALLDEEVAMVADATFERARRELQSFAGVEPADPAPSFAGTLRDYQRDGLGWLKFLERFGFGGCLADDMGLGKTVQVLALLEERLPSRRRQAARLSLVVAPKSVVFNWLAEAERFAPRLKVLDHTGLERPRAAEDLARFDLVLTTYGTLRQDLALLGEVDFDYVILDESQAIKNPRTQAAQAARALKARHRLALSGTPIENHLGELWSLFEFLNPGMLGSSAAFERKSARPDEGERALLSRALRPFILRRTKEQVVSELPEKTEQTLYCDLEGKQKRLYAELQRYYQASLLKAVEARGLARSKIQVLEALLRLRQAACHPGLIDPAKAHEASAKLEALLPLVAEVIEGGHKALVFSQFTSFLAILRSRLDKQGTAYGYLDGQTRDRKAEVERFQTDPAVKLFLVSLKAGGLGLNLTAADYVFLLDPWWNPAVEAQAIDRAHRIGQERRVFAYRLVARETVEEKILALQQEKRDLADSIITADNSLIRKLTREDLELLLS